MESDAYPEFAALRADGLDVFMRSNVSHGYPVFGVVGVWGSDWIVEAEADDGAEWLLVDPEQRSATVILHETLLRIVALEEITDEALIFTVLELEQGVRWWANYTRGRGLEVAFDGFLVESAGSSMEYEWPYMVFGTNQLMVRDVRTNQTTAQTTRGGSNFGLVGRMLTFDINDRIFVYDLSTGANLTHTVPPDAYWHGRQPQPMLRQTTADGPRYYALEADGFQPRFTPATAPTCPLLASWFPWDVYECERNDVSRCIFVNLETGTYKSWPTEGYTMAGCGVVDGIARLNLLHESGLPIHSAIMPFPP